MTGDGVQIAFDGDRVELDRLPTAAEVEAIARAAGLQVVDSGEGER